MIVQHVIIKGRVQGVFFRDYTRKRALLFHLTGWVRNLPNGSVEALFCGDEKMISKMLNWLKQGSPQSRVDDIKADNMQITEIFSTFEIRYQQ